MHEINPNHKEEKPRGFQGVPPIFPKEVKSTSSIRTERARASKDHITSKEERSLECLSPSEAANQHLDSGFNNLDVKSGSTEQTLKNKLAVSL